jgi:hypothetical protein
MSRTKYRIQKTIDVVLEVDRDGEFDADSIDGVARSYPDVDYLRDHGYTVTEVVPAPEDALPGSVRKFRYTGDLIVKGADSRWRYVTATVSGNQVGDILTGFPDGYVITDPVITS